jgi:4-amino-4-deoxy-L-arabinose transferase-like glycosyltransferase
MPRARFAPRNIGSALSAPQIFRKRNRHASKRPFSGLLAPRRLQTSIDRFFRRRDNSHLLNAKQILNARMPSLPARPESERLILGTLLGIVLVRLALLPLYPILDQSEARYATIAMWMADRGDWVTPTMDGSTPFWAKPPLAFWLSAASIKVFGLNEFAVRLPSLLIYVAIIWMTFLIGRDARGRAFGLLAACAFASMGLAFFMAGAVMTDPGLTLGTTMSMVAFWFAMKEPGRRAGYAIFAAFGLALLAKGPVGVLWPVASMVLWCAWNKRLADLWRRLPIVSGALLTLAIGLPWYIIAEHRTPGFLHYFIVGEHFKRFVDPGWTGDLYGAARHKPLGAIWFFDFVATLPWSPVAAWALLRRHIGTRADLPRLRDPWIRFLVCWALVPLVFFTPARNTLISYVLPSMPPLALLTAHLLRRMKWNNYPIVYRMTASGTAILASGVAIAGWMYPRSDHTPTQLPVVEFCAERAEAPDQRLVYLFEEPYSAAFYTHGRARRVTADEAAKTVHSGETKLLIVPLGEMQYLPPSLRKDLTEIEERNGAFIFEANAAHDACLAKKVADRSASLDASLQMKTR